MKIDQDVENDDVGVTSVEALFSMWTGLEWANSQWADVTHNDFLIESLPSVVYLGGEMSQVSLRCFSRVEIIGTGNVYTTVNLYPSHDIDILTRTLSNLGAEQIVRLNEVVLSSTRLRINVRMDSSCLRYRAHEQSVLSIEWTGQASYAFYEPSDSRLPSTVPDEYIQHYNRRNKVEIAIMPRPVSARCQDLYIYMVTTETLRDRNFVFFQQPSAFENVRRVMQKSSPAAYQTFLSALFPSFSFPEVAVGRAPADEAWFGHLVTPPGSVELDGGEETPDGWTSRYKTVPKKPWAPFRNAQKKFDYKIAPYCQIFHAGAQKERLGFVADPVPGAVWSVTGNAGGALVKEGNDHFYLPAKKRPDLIFRQPSETLIPAVTRASLREVPARADVVTAVGQGADACAWFVTTFAYPTHFIRFAAQDGVLQLKCCYFNIDSEEVGLQPQEVTWHVIAGNGAVSDGVFTPASVAATPVTVVMAVDIRDLTEWRFAVSIIPLPLMSARDVVSLQQS
ncbi:hypothetical protein SJI00_05160 [Pseudomonas sp. RP23018S]|uniref:hypothetical protein n=1 Tax=Pseudomonas sp. RP23018S TaxID=3096037 RepID=UPI002ACAA27A|nr:hypothetical protein [Pseudomonas sp. RP23018S]MDZ5602165.1 hypothetical protein [Pseudomonas sp. RP23018S]